MLIKINSPFSTHRPIFKARWRDIMPRICYQNGEIKIILIKSKNPFILTRSNPKNPFSIHFTFIITSLYNIQREINNIRNNYTLVFISI